MLPLYMIHAKAALSLTRIVGLFVFAGGCIFSFCENFHELYMWIISLVWGWPKRSCCESHTLLLRPLKVKFGVGVVPSFLGFPGLMLQFVTVSFQSSWAYRWIREMSLSFAFHMALVDFGFWFSPQRVPDPGSNFSPGSQWWCRLGWRISS